MGAGEFSTGKVQRLEASVYGIDEASQMVLRKAGLVYEGTRRKVGLSMGRFLIFGMVKGYLEGEGRGRGSV